MSRLSEPDTAVGDRAARWRDTAHPTVAVIGVIVSAAVPPFLVGALAPLIGRDMPFSATEVGLSIAAYYLVSGVLSPLGGHAVDRIGVVRALRLSCGITTFGLIAIASASDAVGLILALALLGLPNSVVQPAANAVLAKVGSPRVQALVFGVVQASIPTATLIAGLMLGIASYADEWRWTLLAVAALTLAAMWLTRGLPRATRRAARAGTGAPQATTAPQVAATPQLQRAQRVPFGSPWVMVALVTTGFLASTAATSLPSYIASTGLDVGLAPSVVATAQVLGSLACATTRIGAPLSVSRGTPLRRLVVIGVLLSVGMLGYLSLSTGTAAGFVIGTVAAYAFGWGWNGLFNLVVISVRPDSIAAATGMTQAGVFLGGMVGPLTFAAVVHNHGFGTAWLVASGAAFAAAGAAAVGLLVLRWDGSPLRT